MGSLEDAVSNSARDTGVINAMVTGISLSRGAVKESARVIVDTRGQLIAMLLQIVHHLSRGLRIHPRFAGKVLDLTRASFPVVESVVQFAVTTACSRSAERALGMVVSVLAMPPGSAAVVDARGRLEPLTISDLEQFPGHLLVIMESGETASVVFTPEWSASRTLKRVDVFATSTSPWGAAVSISDHDVVTDCPLTVVGAGMDVQYTATSSTGAPSSAELIACDAMVRVNCAAVTLTSIRATGVGTGDVHALVTGAVSGEGSVHAEAAGGGASVVGVGQVEGQGDRITCQTRGVGAARATVGAVVDAGVFARCLGGGDAAVLVGTMVGGSVRACGEGSGGATVRVGSEEGGAPTPNAVQSAALVKASTRAGGAALLAVGGG